MMKIKNILIYSVVLLSLPACSRFLDVKPQGQVIPETEEEFAAVLNYRLNNIESGAYDDVIGNARTIADYEAYSDNLNANIAIGNLPIYAGTEFNKHNETYADWYTVIKDCNIIIEAMEKRDNEMARQLTAASIGLKGVCYYNLLRNFCLPYQPGNAANELGLCLVDRFDMNVYPERSNLKASAEFVVATLKKSLAYQMKDPKYLFNVDVVEAYLAKTYFWMQDWENALALCKKLAERYPLTDRRGYEELVNAEYEKKPGVIIRSRINDNHDVSNLIHGQAVSDIKSRPVSASFVHLFDEEKDRDIRYATSFGKKRICRKEPVARVREGEIFLMMAECYAHLGKVNEALEVLNLLRLHRIEGVIPYTEESLPEVRKDQLIVEDAEGKPLTRLMSAIFNERRKELFMEGDRWFELKRNGSPEFWIISDQLGLYQKYTMKKYMYTFPIRKGDVDLKDYIKQNEGYEEYL